MPRFVLILLLLFFASFSAELFFDDFSDGNADGWAEYSSHPDSAVYYVEDQWYHILNYPPGAHTAALCGDIPDPDFPHMSTGDYSVYCRAKCIGGHHMGVSARMQGPFSCESGYVLWASIFTDDVFIWRHDQGTSTELISVPMDLEYDQIYWIRFQVDGKYLSGKIWQGALTDEPAEWLLVCEDDTYSSPGATGLICHCYSAAEKHTAVDSVMVTDSFGALEAYTWAGIKRVF